MGWIVGKCKCRSCDDEHISVMPDDVYEPDNTECPKCGHMTCDLIAILEGKRWEYCDE